MPSPPDGAIFEWRPASLLQSRPSYPEPFAVIVLNQPLRCLWAIKRLWAQASYRVAADGGANRLYDARQASGVNFDNLDAVIGDLDSLRDNVRAYFADSGSIIIHDPDQYSTDFGKAVKHIWDRHPHMNIVALGGLGGRVDQGVSQLHHLYLFQENSGGDAAAQGRRMYLLSNESLTFLLPAGHNRIHVREPAEGSDEVFEKFAGILPMQGPSVITIRGFEWDVQDWKTEFGGQMSTSNHVLPDTQVAEVTSDKPIVFTIALKES